MAELQSYVDGWRKRACQAEAARELRIQEAKKIAVLCAQTLVKDFNAGRVFLIGSLAEGTFRLNSDIDLIVEGLAPQIYFSALSHISRIAGSFDIDLIPWESYKDKDEVLENGELLA